MFWVIVAAATGLVLGMRFSATQSARDSLNYQDPGSSRDSWRTRVFCPVRSSQIKNHTIYVFHPSADGGGGGEKCLWGLLKALMLATGTRPRPKDSIWRRWRRMRWWNRSRTGAPERTRFLESADVPDNRNPTASSAPGGGSDDLESPSTFSRIPLRTRVILLVNKNCLSLEQMLANTKRDFDIDLAHDLTLNSAQPDVAEMSLALDGVTLTFTLELRRMRSAWMLQYPYQRATRLFQMLSGILVAFEAAWLRLWSDSTMARDFPGHSSVEVWDTVGCTQAASLFAFLSTVYRVKVRSYIHWPFITREVVNRHPMGTSQWWYDSCVLTLYYLVGTWGCWKPVTVNSTFTWKRLSDTWNLTGPMNPEGTNDEERRERNPECQIVYPPVKLEPMSVPDATDRQDIVVSVAQFRPEKNHRMQIEIIRKLILEHDIPPATQFVICGSSRPGQAGDREYVLSLLREALQLLPADRCIVKCDPEELLTECQNQIFTRNSADDQSEALQHKKHVVEFKVNRPMAELETVMRNAKVALHTMVEEHFGIVVVDFLTYGLWVVAHNSGGPRDDILRAPNATERRKIILAEEDGISRENNAPNSPSTTEPDGPRVCGRVGSLATNVEEFCRGIETGLRRDDQVIAKIKLGQELMKIRFKDAEGYGRQVLDAWARPDEE